jgi:hypothetical protein
MGFFDHTDKRIMASPFSLTQAESNALPDDCPLFPENFAIF